MTKRRILVISNLCPPDFDGGYELRAFQIAHALRERGHSVELASSEYRESFSGPKSDPFWVHRILRYVDVSPSRTAWRYIDRIPRRIRCSTIAEQNIVRMRDFIASREYDLAYCFGFHRISLATVLPLEERQIPLLWHLGDGYIADHLYHFPKTSFAYRFAHKLFAGRSFALEKERDYQNVAFVSRFLQRECIQKGFCPPNQYVIHRGFDGEPANDIAVRIRTTPPLFLLACRVDPQKGIHVAIEGAGRLFARRPDMDWTMEIAGVSHSGYERYLRTLISHFGLERRVRFLGRISRSEVLRRMRAATAFISSATYGEPFAGTIIETMAIGTPLIGSNAGSILEVAEDNVSALVYEKHDARQLSAHMERLLSEPLLGQRLASSAVRVIADRFSINTILEQTESVFEQIIANHSLSVQLTPVRQRGIT